MATPISRTITNMSAMFSWDGNDYPLGSFDTVEITRTLTRGKVFSHARNSDGVTTMTGGETQDTVTLTATDLDYDFAKVLQSFFKSGSRQKAEVSLTHNEDPNIKIILASATVTSDLFQGNYDDNWGSYFTITFGGQIVTAVEGNISFD